MGNVVLFSKRICQRIGMNDDGFFKKNKETVTSLSNALAFAAKMRKAGVTHIAGANTNRVRGIYMSLYNVGLHHATVKGYVNTLVVFGLAEMKGNTLVLNKIRSSNRDRNFEIPFDREESIRHLAQKFAELIVSSSMRAIGYVLRLKERLEDPKDLKELKILKSRARRLGFDIDRFKDNGVSYSLLSRRFNTSKPTIVRIVKSCCLHGIISVVRHKTVNVIRKVSRTIVDIGKFLSSISDMITYHRYNANDDTLLLYKVKSNSYIYNPKNSKSLSYNIGI